MTTIYFVRHAKPNSHNHDDSTRELSEKGLKDRELVTDFLGEEEIHAIFSSPFKRSVDTVRPLAELKNLPIHRVENFRERRVAAGWIEDFPGFCRRQWEDFHYKLPEGESLSEVQSRNIAALNRLLTEYEGRTLVVGSHGTAMSTIINYYDQSFGYEDFTGICNLMPWVVEFTFSGRECTSVRKYDLFTFAKGK